MRGECQRKGLRRGSTRNTHGAFLFFRGYCLSNEGTAVVVAMRTSLPTFPQVSLTPQMLDDDLAMDSMMSESRSRPPAAPGSIGGKLEKQGMGRCGENAYSCRS